MYVPLVCVYVCEDADIQTYFPWSILLNFYFIPTMGQMRTLVPEASIEDMHTLLHATVDCEMMWFASQTGLSS